MASEKQIAANRANAQRSTGPRTAVGKMRSSRNAFRHGLSGPLPFDSMTSAKVDAIAQALVGEEAGEEQFGVGRGVCASPARGAGGSARHVPNC